MLGWVVGGGGGGMVVWCGDVCSWCVLGVPDVFLV